MKPCCQGAVSSVALCKCRANDLPFQRHMGVPYSDFVLNIQPDDYLQLNKRLQHLLDNPAELRAMQVRAVGAGRAQQFHKHVLPWSLWRYQCKSVVSRNPCHAAAMLRGRASCRADGYASLQQGGTAVMVQPASIALRSCCLGI